jgi:hypothetical protein
LAGDQPKKKKEMEIGNVGFKPLLDYLHLFGLHFFQLSPAILAWLFPFLD